MGPGDVLVASITTPAWTPLFAMAAAVVTDIGGPLSHSSIVAREYGIPAVLAPRSRPGGSTRQRIRVDGDAGNVTLLDAEDRGPEPASVADRPTARHRLRPLAGLAAAAGAVAVAPPAQASPPTQASTKIHASWNKGRLTNGGEPKFDK